MNRTRMIIENQKVRVEEIICPIAGTNNKSAKVPWGLDHCAMHYSIAQKYPDLKNGCKDCSKFERRIDGGCTMNEQLECFYCGTKKDFQNCCSEADRVYKQRVISLFKAGSPTDAQFDEMATALAAYSYNNPEQMKNINNHVGLKHSASKEEGE